MRIITPIEHVRPSIGEELLAHDADGHIKVRASQGTTGCGNLNLTYVLGTTAEIVAYIIEHGLSEDEDLL